MAGGRTPPNVSSSCWPHNFRWLKLLAVVPAALTIPSWSQGVGIDTDEAVSSSYSSSVSSSSSSPSSTSKSSRRFNSLEGIPHEAPCSTPRAATSGHVGSAKAATAPFGRHSTSSMQVKFDDEANFDISIGEAIWLRSASIRFFANDQWYCTTTTNRVSNDIKDELSSRSGKIGSSNHHLHTNIHKNNNKRNTDHDSDVENKKLLWRTSGALAGQDSLGSYRGRQVEYVAEDDPALQVVVAIKVYEEQKYLVFEQILPNGANRTRASRFQPPEDGHRLDHGHYEPVLAYPSFTRNNSSLDELGFVTWSHDGQVKTVSGLNVTEHLEGLSTNGPVVLFDEQLNCVVVAPMNNFKSAVHTASIVGQAWHAGVSSELMSLPPNFVHRTMVLGGKGIAAAMERWGRVMQSYYAVSRRQQEKDASLNYLSYWTDNGAFYYGDAWGEAGGGGQVCNEESLLEVAAGLKEQGLLSSVRSWQLDDWWYSGHESIWVHCIDKWKPRKSAFPSGLGNLSRLLGAPWVLYVPFFCEDNEFTKDFQFLTGSHGNTTIAVPHPDQALAFYRRLMTRGANNGMQGFEHDFLNYNFLATSYLRTNYDAGSRWLGSLDRAARESELSVQFCMAMPSDLMSTLELPSVTNFRASDDYQVLANFDIGGNSLLGWALGLRPSKDNFWTTRPKSVRATNKPYKATDYPGSDCELNLILATMSTGPVGLGDKAGETNKTLLMRGLRDDGLILQPDRPLLSIDSSFWPGAWSSNQPALLGKVLTTTSSPNQVSSSLMWHYIVAINLTSPWPMHSRDFHPLLDPTTGWVVSRFHRDHHPNECGEGELALASGCLSAPPIWHEGDLPALKTDRPVMLQNDSLQYDLWQFSPIASTGWVLLGEVGKYTRVSRQRFLHIEFPPEGGVDLRLGGHAAERVTIVALEPVRSCEHDAIHNCSRPGMEVSEWRIRIEKLTFTNSLPKRCSIRPNHIVSLSEAWI